jgi:hypothetical protein
MIIYLFSVAIFKFCLKERGFIVPCVMKISLKVLNISNILCESFTDIPLLSKYVIPIRKP